MVFIEATKRFTPTYNGPLTYNNAARDVTSCIIFSTTYNGPLTYSNAVRDVTSCIYLVLLTMVL
jgi:hypothetical protein